MNDSISSRYLCEPSRDYLGKMDAIILVFKIGKSPLSPRLNSYM